MIGWGFMFRSRVSAVVSLVRVFRCGKIPNPHLVLKT
jgi:hypothetical protein